MNIRPDQRRPAKPAPAKPTPATMRAMAACRRAGHTVIAPAALKLYFLVRTFHRDHGYSPTLREIAAITDVGSTYPIEHRLKLLAKVGLLNDQGGTLSRRFTPATVALQP